MITCKNPILSGFYPDPSICRVGEWFYLVTSTFAYFPGIPVFRSRNLAQWEQIGNILTRESQLPLQGCEHNEGIYLVPQILTNSAHDFIRTARGLEDYGYQEINLNLGCPSKPVVKGGRGSGFLEKRKELDSFLDEIFSRTRQKIKGWPV